MTEQEIKKAAIDESFTFRMTKTMRAELKQVAETEDRSEGWIAREAVEQYLKGLHGSADSE